MKKIFCVLLIAVLLISLCACGADADTSSIESVEVSQTESVEPSSKETSSADTTSTATSSKEESVAETSSTSTIKHGKVTITLDNWDEYFEFVTEEYWEENAFGEATRLNFLHYFRLKEEYKLKSTSNSVAVEYTYKRTSSMDYIPATVDLEQRTYTLGEFPSEILQGRRTVKFTGLPESVGDMSRVLADDELYEYCWDFDVTRIEGTIYLK